jgi:hypothetical protein
MNEGKEDVRPAGKKAKVTSAHTVTNAGKATISQEGATLIEMRETAMEHLAGTEGSST